MKSILLSVVLVLSCCILQSQQCNADRKDTDTNAKEVTLNKHQLACLAVTIAEMQRRHWSFRAYQVVIRDEGSSYDIAFMEDPLNMTQTGGDGMAWKVRKRDLKIVSGSTFYR